MKKLCLRSQSRTQTCQASGPPWSPPDKASWDVKMDRTLQGARVGDLVFQSHIVWDRIGVTARLTAMPFRFSEPLTSQNLPSSFPSDRPGASYSSSVSLFASRERGW